MSNPYTLLENAFANDAAEWLQENAPDVYSGVEAAVQAKKTPAEIRRYVLQLIGEDRTAMAERVKLAAIKLSGNI